MATQLFDGNGDTVVGSNGRFKITIDKLLTWAIAALLAWATVNTRVAVLESRVDGLKADVAEIRNDVKTLLYRTR